MDYWRGYRISLANFIYDILKNCMMKFFLRFHLPVSNISIFSWIIFFSSFQGLELSISTEICNLFIMTADFTSRYSKRFNIQNLSLGASLKYSEIKEIIENYMAHSIIFCLWYITKAINPKKSNKDPPTFYPIRKPNSNAYAIILNY